MQTKKLAKLLGISHQLCNRHKKLGMPCESMEAAIKWRESNLDIVRTKAWRADGNKGKRTNETQAVNSKPIEELKQAVSATQLDLETKDAETLYRNARALRLKAEALQAAAEHEHYMGKMVKREVIERAAFDTMRALRDNLVNIGRRLSVDVANEASAIKCEKLIKDEINLALHNVTKKLDAYTTVKRMQKMRATLLKISLSSCYDYA